MRSTTAAPSAIRGGPRLTKSTVFRDGFVGAWKRFANGNSSAVPSAIRRIPTPSSPRALDKDVYGDDRKAWLERHFPNEHPTPNNHDVPKSSHELRQEREAADRTAMKDSIRAEVLAELKGEKLTT